MVRPCAGLAERGEVAQPDQGRGRPVHRVDVERVAHHHGVVAAQRVEVARPVADPVAVAPVHRGEAGVEPGRGLAHRAHHDVVGQHAVQPGRGGDVRRTVRAPGDRGPPGRVDVQVADRATGVHAGVGATGGGQRHRRHPQHRGQRGRQLALDRAPSGLGGPPGEAGAVVGEVDPQPHHRGVGRREPGTPHGGAGLVVAHGASSQAVRRSGQAVRRRRRTNRRRPSRSRPPRPPPRRRTRPRPRSGRTRASPRCGTSSSSRCP